MKRIGFACDWLDNFDQAKGLGVKDETQKFHTKTTTLTWINKQTKQVAEQRLYDLMIHNIESVNLLVRKVAKLDDIYKFVRISSDILPFYTEPTWSYFWRQNHILELASKSFSEVGRFARSNNVRLSMHPGQFCVLASATRDIVERSLLEFEYHADIARMMGYGEKFQDFKINVHIAGKQGPEGIKRILNRLSPEARNSITIENEENVHGLDICLSLGKLVPIVLDIHHHWVRENEFIQPTDDRVQRVLDSWRGTRPVIHYSLPRQDALNEVNPNILPQHTNKRQKLRAHSDFFWNQPANDWALSFLDNFDIMCEAKAKNLASFNLK